MLTHASLKLPTFIYIFRVNPVFFTKHIFSCEDECSSRRRRNAELSGTTDSLSQQFNLYGGPYIVKEGGMNRYY